LTLNARNPTSMKRLLNNTKEGFHAEGMAWCSSINKS
jgi:hypothetical protein